MTEAADSPTAATYSRKSTLVILTARYVSEARGRHGGSIEDITPGGGSTPNALAAVQLPTLWRRIDVSGNRRRHPADTEAGKDQQGGLRALAAPDSPYEYQNNRPGDGEASAVDPIVSEAKHLIPLFLSKDTMYNCSSVGTLMGGESHPNLKYPIFSLGCGSPLPQRSIPLLVPS